MVRVEREYSMAEQSKAQNWEKEAEYVKLCNKSKNKYSIV